MPNESFESVCLSVILLNSVYKKDNKFLSSGIFRRM